MRRNGLTRGKRPPQWRGLVLPALLLLVWQTLCASEVFTPDVMPSPVAVATELLRLWTKGRLFGDIVVTAERVALGFLLGTAVATVVGAAVGYSRRAGEYLDPTLQALKAVPSLAWVPPLHPLVRDFRGLKGRPNRGRRILSRLSQPLGRDPLDRPQTG